MKTRLLMLGAIFALPLFAEPLAVNATAVGPFVDAQELTLPVGTAVADKATVVISATMKFTLPTAMPEYNTTVTAEDKLVLVADPDGKLLVADATQGAWRDTGVTVTESDSVQVRAVGTQADAGRLTFDLTLTVKEVETTVAGILSPATNTTLSALAFEGEGEAKDVSVALVSTAILPAGGGEGATQDAALVTAYAEWVNGVGKEMKNESPDAQQDAFAMNVGGAPKLEITAIDTTARTITVKGSYVAAEGEVVADLKTINGKLYITSATTLEGTPTTTVVDLSVVQDKLATINIPDGAQFIKAHVALVTPANEL